MILYVLFKVFFLLAIFCAINFGQDKSRTEVFAAFKTDENIQRCETAGKFIALPKPAYPKEAKYLRVGGTVELKIELNEKGKVLLIKTVYGLKMLQAEAVAAAEKLKFQPPVCSGQPVKTSALLTYNFIPSIPLQKYFIASEIGDLIDLEPDSQYYQSVANLAKNYGLGIGYDDQHFYSEAPLTRGDFALFLRLTLDLLAEKAKNVNKIPRDINLFYSKNPQHLSMLSDIKIFEIEFPYAETIKILFLKYNIVLLDEKKEFRGAAPLMRNELIDLWSDIFGAEAVPVNFQKVENDNRIISRGEFALFLDESLQVLSYKVLP